VGVDHPQPLPPYPGRTPEDHIARFKLWHAALLELGGHNARLRQRAEPPEEPKPENPEHDGC
jgi:hypothetical protein